MTLRVCLSDTPENSETPTPQHPDTGNRLKEGAQGNLDKSLDDKSDLASAVGFGEKRSSC